MQVIFFSFLPVAGHGYSRVGCTEKVKRGLHSIGVPVRVLASSEALNVSQLAICKMGSAVLPFFSPLSGLFRHQFLQKKPVT